jgi:hypothetical protein
LKRRIEGNSTSKNGQTLFTVYVERNVVPVA